MITLNNLRVARPAYAANAQAPSLPIPRRGRGRGPTGGVTAEAAQPVLMTTNDLVRACYRPFLALSPQAAGTVITLMRINPDGGVSDVETIGSPDPSLSLMVPCLFSALRSRRFPQMGAPSLVSFPFTFRSGEVGASNAPAPEMPRARPGEVQVMNPETIVARPWRPTITPSSTIAPTHTRELAEQIVPDITSLIDACYGAVLVDRRDFAGDFTLRLVVEPSGRVTQSEITPPTFDPLFRQCVTTLDQQLVFHPSANGANIGVQVSLVVTEAPGSTEAPAAPATSPTSGLLPLSAGPR